MSRIGKKPIEIPSNVTVTIDGHTVTVKGPKGELKQTFDKNLNISLEDGVLEVTRPNSCTTRPNKNSNKQHGSGSNRRI